MGYLDTWINPEGITNIISTPNIYNDVYCITYYTKEERIVYTPEGKMINFKRNNRYFEGIRYIDLSNTE